MTDKIRNYHNSNAYLGIHDPRPSVVVKIMPGMKALLRKHLAQSQKQNGVNSSPLGPNGRYFADDIFRCIFVNEKILL